MTRSLISVSAGLIAAVSLVLTSTAVDAGHRHGRYQDNCCQQVSSCDYQQSGYATRHSRSRNHGYYAHTQYDSGCCQQTVAYAPATYSAPVTTAYCAPQAACCAGVSATTSGVTPANYATSPAPMPPAPPAPISGN